MSRISDKIAIILISLSAVFFVLFSIYSEGNWGGADSYVHYRISRYSWIYPHLFLDLWGKPLFNILSSPFSQFGFLGIKIFNVVVSLLSAVLVYDLAKHFKWDAGFSAVVMLLFTPIYFIVIPSGLTEPLFGLVLLIAIWLFFKDRLLLSALVISFIPFARNEGFVLIPLFLLAFILKRKYFVIPFLTTGFLLFSLIGWWFHHDFKKSCNWLIQEGFDDHLIYYYDPLIPFYMEKNPFDSREVHEFVDDRENPGNGMPKDAILVWDAHFSPNEGGLRLERLINNDSFQLLKKIAPEHAFTTLNDYKYEIYIFKRL